MSRISLLVELEQVHYTELTTLQLMELERQF